MGRIDRLAEKLREHLQTPWQMTVSGAQRVIMVVYEPQAERSLRGKLEIFAQAARDADREWYPLDLAPTFARWIGKNDYREAYFKRPEHLALKIETEFPAWLATQV